MGEDCGDDTGDIVADSRGEKGGRVYPWLGATTLVGVVDTRSSTFSTTLLSP